MRTSIVEEDAGSAALSAKVALDEKLAKIVLVSKNVMEDWRKAQESLRHEMKDESDKVDTALRQEKYNQEKKIAKMEKEKTDELNDKNQKYDKLQKEEAEQKDDKTQQMKKMEIEHNQCKEELQDLYEFQLQTE